MPRERSSVVAFSQIGKYDAPFNERLIMIMNASFSNVRVVADHVMTAGHTLARAVRHSSLAAALKNICNRLTHHDGPQGNARDQGKAGHVNPTRGAAALWVFTDHLVEKSSVDEQGLSIAEQKILARVNQASADQLANSLESAKLVTEIDASKPWIRSQRDLESFLEPISRLPPEWRVKPLYALGEALALSLREVTPFAQRELGRWTDEAQLSAISLFCEAAEEVPQLREYRLGAGMHEAAKKTLEDKESIRFHGSRGFESAALELAHSEISATSARYSQPLRQAIAAKFGLTENRDLRSLEWRVMSGPATELLESGYSVEDALDKHDLRLTKAWEGWWGHARRGFDEEAIKLGAHCRRPQHVLQYYLE